VFAIVALISANRNAGLLTVGAVGDVSSALRGTVRVGVAYLLVPVGAVFWLAGRWGRPRPSRPRPGGAGRRVVWSNAGERSHRFFYRPFNRAPGLVHLSEITIYETVETLRRFAFSA
jgi:hypothetical protein